MAQTIKLKRSANTSLTSGQGIPTTSDLALGEVAINTYHGTMYIKKNDGTDAIVEIGGASSGALPLAGGTMTGALSMGDDIRARFGDSNDLQIYHNNDSSYIRDVGTGTLFIDTNGARISLISDGSYSNGKMADFVKDGAVTLYHDNSTKLATTSTGINVTGDVVASGRIKTTDGLFQADEGSQHLRQYAVSSGSGTQSFLLGKIKSSNSADGGVTGIVKAAYDYGDQVTNVNIHFTFSQRSGLQRGHWWYENTDDDTSTDVVSVKVVDDGSNNYYVWLHVGDYVNCFVETTWRQVSSSDITDSGSISAGTITTGTTLFDTVNDPTSEHHIGKLYAHDDIAVTGNLTTAYAGHAKNTIEAVGDYFPYLDLKRTGASSKTNYSWTQQIGSTGFFYIRDATNNFYSLTLNTSGDVLLSSDTSGANAILTLDRSAGTGTFSGQVNASGGNSGQWNTAYTYSQVGHLPLTGGTLTGGLTGTTAEFTGANGTALEVNSGTTNVVATFESGDAQAWVNLKDSSSGTYGVLVGAEGGLFRVRPNNNDASADFEIATTGNVTASGTISATGGNSTNWNTAYTYSQVGHLPLAGGTLTGTTNITADGADLIVNSADYELALLGNRGSTGVDLDKAYLRMKAEGTNTIVLDTAGLSYFNGGNVGIGITAPDAKLRIDQDAAATGLKVTGGSGGTNIAQFIRDVGGNASVNINASGSDPQIQFVSAGNTFALGVNSNTFEIADNSVLGTNTRFSITNAGNVGIGTSAPTNTDYGSVIPKLHIKQSGTNGAFNLVARFEAGGDTEATGGAILINHSNDRGLLIEGGRDGSGSAADDEGVGHLGILTSSGAHTRMITLRQNMVGASSVYNVGIGTTAPQAKLQVEDVGIDTTATSTTAITQVAIDTFAAATFRSARYTIQATNSTDSTYHITEVLLIHDGTNAYITEYGTMFTGSSEGTISADIAAGNVRLLVTPASTDTIAWKVVRHSILV